MPRSVHSTEVTKRRNKENEKKVKECPPGSILNTVTNRCNKLKVDKAKECDPGKVWNFVTKRCIKKVSSDMDGKKKVVHKKKAVKEVKVSNDKLYFHSKSKDVEPGKGVNEVVEDIGEYEVLKGIKGWRQVLSNFHWCPFKFEGYTYNTIEHVFQAKKIELVSPDKALLFTVESGNEIGEGDGGVARKHRKLVVLEKEDLVRWANMRSDVMYRAALAKYKTCREALNVLRATAKAQLWHVVSRSKVHDHFEHLEKVRAELC